MQLDPELRYVLPPDATISRLADETGLERGQVARFFERRLVPRPELSSDAESDTGPELEPWDYGLSEAKNAATAGQSGAASAKRRGPARSAPSASDSEASGEDDAEEVRRRCAACVSPWC
jgi:hypothetical protein